MWGMIVGAALAVVGAVAGAISTSKSRKEQIKQLKEYRAELERRRDAAIEELTLDYDIAKTEATKSADTSDRHSTLNERIVSDDVNNQIYALALAQQQEGLAWNNEAISAGQSEGSSLAALSASGTRSSSMQEAVEMQAAQNAAQIQAGEDSQRASDQYSLVSLLNNTQNNVFNLQTDRTTAYDLRQSYEEGGSNYEKFSLNKKNINESYAYDIDSVNDQIDSLKNTSFWDTVSSFFGGASSGWSIGSSLGDAASQASKSISYVTAMKEQGVSTWNALKSADYNTVNSWYSSQFK